MKKNIAIICIVLSFLVGFFAGSEYTKYKIRSTINEGLAAIGDAFGDISSDETVKNDKKIERTTIPFGEGHEFIGKSEGEAITVKVREIIDRGIEYSTDSWTTHKGNNNISSVIIESENTGKVMAYKSLSEYNVILITKDGYEYAPMSSEQLSERPEGYGGCVSCSSNPEEKNVEEILFDIAFDKLKGATLILDEDDIVEFKL